MHKSDMYSRIVSVLPRPLAAVSQCEKFYKCHAERSEASRVFCYLQRRDSSPSAQNDIATQSLVGEGKMRVCVVLASPKQKAQLRSDR